MTGNVTGFTGSRRGPTPQDRESLIQFVEAVVELARQDDCSGVCVGVLMGGDEIMVDWLLLPGGNRHDMISASTILQHNLAHNALSDGIPSTKSKS